MQLLNPAWTCFGSRHVLQLLHTLNDSVNADCKSEFEPVEDHKLLAIDSNAEAGRPPRVRQQ